MTGEHDAYLETCEEIGNRISTRAFAGYAELRVRGNLSLAQLVWVLDFEARLAQLNPTHRFLLRLAADGYSQRDMAALYGCCLRSMVRLCVLYGIEPSPGRQGKLGAGAYGSQQQGLLPSHKSVILPHAAESLTINAR